ncbi:MAG: hypothetical protein HZC25_12475 [Rhodospirillales bacterium]|nr:hypothetical protein [Rhodospirillales bacterium]
MTILRILLAALFLSGPFTAQATDSWDAKAIGASRAVSALAPARAQPLPDRLLAIAGGDPRLIVIKAATLTIAASLPLPGPPAGPPLVAPDGRFAYMIGQDGWIERIDLASLRASGRIRVGRAASGLALSEDGAWLLAALDRPGQLVALRAPELELFRVIPARSDRGQPSSAGAVQTVPGRASFVALLPEIAEIWELSHDALAPPVYSGMVHSFEKGLEEAVGETQPFARRRTKAQAALGAFFLSPDGVEIGGAAVDGSGGAIYNLDARRLAARIPADLRLAYAAARPVAFHAHPAMIVPVLGRAELVMLDRRHWQVLGSLPLAAPARFLAVDGEGGPVFASGFAGPLRDAIEILDPASRQRLALLRPVAGATLGPILLADRGRLIYAVIEGPAGGVATFDTAGQKPVKRLELADILTLVAAFPRPEIAR